MHTRADAQVAAARLPLCRGRGTAVFGTWKSSVPSRRRGWAAERCCSQLPGGAGGQRSPSPARCGAEAGGGGGGGGRGEEGWVAFLVPPPVRAAADQEVTAATHRRTDMFGRCDMVAEGRRGGETGPAQS